MTVGDDGLRPAQGPVVRVVAPGDVPETDVVALGFHGDPDGQFRLAAALPTHLADDPVGAEDAMLAVLGRQEAKGTAGEVVEHPLTADGAVTVLLLGTGKGTPGELRRAGGALARRVRGRQQVCVLLGETDPDALTAFTEGLLLGSFTFHRRTTAPPAPAAAFLLAGPSDAGPAQRAVATGVTLGRSGWFSRALATTPSNEKNPEWLAQLARAVAEETGLSVRVWDADELARDGFGGLVGVGQGSDSPPRLVQLEYTPARTSRRTPHVVLVGKGITFDTGGLSIKPAEAMMNMKRDMTGAGVVLAVMSALGELGCAVKVTGLLACAENSISGRSIRPGDVVRHYGGRTSEVTNTDAEGRLVLGDALAYAVAELSPTTLVDIATLTGAMKVALGLRTGGLFATDDALADHLLGAGTAAGEPLWRMPLADDYEELLESTIADADNAPGGPGAVTAALFLRPFTGGVPWAHLDIASAGDSPVDAHEWTAGPTGFGTRALLRWLTGPAPLAGVPAPRRKAGRG